MTGLAPILACAGYAGLLWLIALSLDAVGRRSLRPPPGRTEEVAIGSDVARFHAVLAGAALGAGAFVLAAYVIARHDGPALLLLPIVVACLGGAARRIVITSRPAGRSQGER